MPFVKAKIISEFFQVNHYKGMQKFYRIEHMSKTLPKLTRICCLLKGHNI